MLTPSASHRYPHSQDYLTGPLTSEGLQQFAKLTVGTRESVASLWCGGSPIALGLLTLLHLIPTLSGQPLAQSDSLRTAPLEATCGVRMTCPPPAHHHWVGHLAAGFYP